MESMVDFYREYCRPSVEHVLSFLGLPLVYTSYSLELLFFEYC